MGMLNTGKSSLSLLLSVSGVRPGYMTIGNGIGAFNNGQTQLVNDLNMRLALGSADLSIPQNISWTSAYGATTMSGIQLTEFGLSTDSSGGTIWNRDTFGAITFDGTNELQIQITFQIF